MKLYFATYNQQFDRDKGQDYGRLAIRSLTADSANDGYSTPKGITEVIYTATCSRSTQQSAGSIHETGGLMPPEYRVKEFALAGGTFKAWTLETKVQFRQTIGIEGKCFQIFPVYVNTDQGKLRGEFFVHEDKNIEGSLGCTVLSKERFADFVSRMAKLRLAGVLEMPFFVTYS